MPIASYPDATRAVTDACRDPSPVCDGTACANASAGNPAKATAHAFNMTGTVIDPPRCDTSITFKV
jgi:hypothetical protein